MAGGGGPLGIGMGIGMGASASTGSLSQSRSARGAGPITAGGSVTAAAAAAVDARMALQQADFRSQRMIYAKINYLPLDGIAPHQEPVVSGRRKN